MCNKPIISNQIFSIKYTKQNPPNQVNQIKSRGIKSTKQCLKCNEPNITNQIYLINPTKLNPTNKFYQTKSRETKSMEN